MSWVLNLNNPLSRLDSWKVVRQFWGVISPLSLFVVSLILWRVQVGVSPWLSPILNTWHKAPYLTERWLLHKTINSEILVYIAGSSSASLRHNLVFFVVISGIYTLTVSFCCSFKSQRANTNPFVAFENEYIILRVDYAIVRCYLRR